MITKQIKFNDLSRQWEDIEESCMDSLLDMLRSGWYIGGPYLDKFEKSFAEYTGRKHAIGVSNGTDGLKLAIQSMNLEGKTNVIMAANTYIADIIAVYHQVRGDFEVTLLDHDDYFLLDLNHLENHLDQNRDKYDNVVIMAVHLYGQPIDMIKLESISDKYDCRVLEDASQSHGAMYDDEMVGTRSEMCVYSLYPGKSLGAIGDAGIVTTDNEEHANSLKSLRNYGSNVKYHYDDIGWNNRMDPLQAIFLDEKLRLLDGWNEKKNKIAEMYTEHLGTCVETPKVASHVDLHVYHIYAILCEDRENLQKFLNDRGIPTVIHYPIPIHMTKPYRHMTCNDCEKTMHNADRLLSLPMHPYLSEDDVKFVCDSILEFYNETN